MARARAALALLAVVAVALVVVSGGSDADPQTPAGLPGLPPPFLGAAVSGGGGLTAAVDAYGDLVDLRPSPAGPALIDNPSARQAAGTVPAATGIVPRVSVGGGPALPLWRADSVAQRYLRGTNVVRTVVRFGMVEAAVTVAARGRFLAIEIGTRGAGTPSASVDAEGGVRCARERQAGQLDLLCRVGRAVPPVSGAAALIRTAAASNRRWLARAKPLGRGAPGWARQMYERSLLTLRALTDRRTGAVAAGARDGWAYVWPRDAATAALAYAAAGYRGEARRVAGFLAGVDLDGSARFYGNGEAVPGRGPQGDAAGWAAVAAQAAGLTPPPDLPWRNRADYQEGSAGEYLGNAIAANAPLQPFMTARGLVRRAHDPASGIDSAAGWAVRPFSLPPLYPLVRRTLLNLVAEQTRYGITPGEGWRGGSDPWTAPTAWTAWSFAALGERGQALRLLGDLRRAATQAGDLPERVDAHTGVPRSTTPLAWSHAFAILALLELWP